MFVLYGTRVYKKSIKMIVFGGLEAAFFLVLFSNFYYIKHKIVYLLPLMGMILCLVGTIKTIKEHRKIPFIPLKIGVDAFGERYDIANSATWFFTHLEPYQIEEIKLQIQKFDNMKEDYLSLCKTKRRRRKLEQSFNEVSKSAFEFIIYRTTTKYSQYNYVKTPYKAKVAHWSDFYSLEKVKKIFTNNVKYVVAVKNSKPSNVTVKKIYIKNREEEKEEQPKPKIVYR